MVVLSLDLDGLIDCGSIGAVGHKWMVEELVAVQILAPTINMLTCSWARH